LSDIRINYKTYVCNTKTPWPRKKSRLIKIYLLSIQKSHN
jgi:hypothetical protein